MKIDGVYVINLEKNNDSWERTRKTFETNGFKPNRILAVDGNTLSEEFYKNNCTLKCSTLCSNKMIAIAASHIKCWAEMLNRGDKAAIIAEDDVVLVTDFKKKLEKLQPPTDWDVLFLGCFACDSAGPSLYFQAYNLYLGKPIDAGRKINNNIHVPHMALGTHCYLVSEKGAKRLLELFNGNIDDHVDVQMQKYFSNGKLKNYSISSLISSQTSSKNFSGFPRLFNNALKGIFVTSDKGMSLPFYLSTPGIEIFGFPVNVWSGLFVIAAILCSFFKVEFNILLQVTVLIFLPDILKLDVKNVCIMLFVMYVSYTLCENARAAV